MAYFAEVDTKNIVIRVLAVGDKKTRDENGNEVEAIGAKYLSDGFGGKWKRTSYNTHGGVHSLGGVPFRKNYAGIGYSYDEKRDAFIAPKFFPSWTLNEDTCQWDAPTAYPDDGNRYNWNEKTTSWER